MNKDTAEKLLEAIQWTADAKDGIAYKQLCLAVLAGSIRNYGDKQVPCFSETSKILSVPKETLHRWWVDYNEIMAGSSDDLLSHLDGILKEKVKIGLLISTSEIMTRLEDETKLAQLTLKELLMIKKTLFSDDRLINGKSTSNRRHTISYPAERPGTQKKLPPVEKREIEQKK